MNLFKTKGFDNLIGPGLVINGDVILHGTTVVEGYIDGIDVHTDHNAQPEDKTTLIVNQGGVVRTKGEVRTNTLTVSGTIESEAIHADTLVVRDGGRVTAKVISYLTLRVEGTGRVDGLVQQREASGGPV